MAQRVANEPMRILCFGDSLTEGYSRFGLIFSPYSKALKIELEVKFWAGSGKREVNVATDGQSGDLATSGGFKERMLRRYSVESTASPIYTWVLFLGGTNDLGWGKQPEEIWTSLKSISNIPLSHGSKVLMMTIPECGVKSESLDKKRNELNKMIKEDDRKDVYVFDLHAKIPYHSMQETERDMIWDDGLHFTSKGYERMGEMVAERLVEILEAEKAESSGKELR